MTPNIADIIHHHVSLEVRCIDRVYLHAYMPELQTSGGLCYFLHDYLGYRVPSPALLTPRHDRFVAAIQQFAQDRQIPFVGFERGQIRVQGSVSHRAIGAAYPDCTCDTARALWNDGSPKTGQWQAARSFRERPATTHKLSPTRQPRRQ